MADIAKMTIKQRKWLEGLCRDRKRDGSGTQRQATTVMDGSLANIGYDNVRKMEIPIAELMDRMGFE